MEWSPDSHGQLQSCDKTASDFFFRLPVQERQVSLAQPSPIHVRERGVAELHSCWEMQGQVSLLEGRNQYPRLRASGSPTGDRWHPDLSLGLVLCHHRVRFPQLGTLRRDLQSLPFIFTLKPTRLCFLLSLSVFLKVKLCDIKSAIF